MVCQLMCVDWFSFIDNFGHAEFACEEKLQKKTSSGILIVMNFKGAYI